MDEAIKTIRDRALVIALDTVIDHLDQISQMPGGSDVERLLFIALTLVAKVGQREHTPVHFWSRTRLLPSRWNLRQGFTSVHRLRWVTPISTSQCSRTID